MSVTYPANGTNPVLDLTLPTFSDAVDVVLTNNTSGDSLTLELPESWDGDDLTLDFAAGTIVDQTGADRSALLSGTDRSLWVAAPLAVGVNDVEIEVVDLTTPVPGSAGPLSPGTLADAGGTGTIAWQDTARAASSNNSYASAFLTLGDGTEGSHYLKATNFGFSIPASEQITGFVVEIERQGEFSPPPDASIYDTVVSLVRGGTVEPTNKADLLTAWPDADAYKSYGGASDLWGGTWSPTEVNASDFGVALAVRREHIAVALVDHIRVTVHYESVPEPETPEAYGGVASWSWRKFYW